VTRIGIANAVPDPWGARLQDYRTGLGDTTATGIPTHVTLIPPLEVAPDDLGRVEDHLDKVAAVNPEFRIHLRGTGTFRPISPVVFANLAAGGAECERLASAVRSGPLAMQLTFPYHPHVTIAHDLDDALLDRAFEDLASFECDFRAGVFSLYVHDVDDGWLRTRDFRLGPSADEPSPAQIDGRLPG
jgi:2'-5' RNA ligase